MRDDTPRPAPITPDAQSHWVTSLPHFAQPYARLARLDRPIGTWLLFWPCTWGLALAHSLPQDIYMLLLFGLGALAMRSAGCVYNDIVDADLDAQVARTQNRPLASGAISLKAAWRFLGALLLLGLFVLIQLRPFAQGVALGSLLLVGAYPFMKRITWWPQAWLGLTFNWGVLVAFAAATDTLSAAALWLYAAGIFWTLGYDTIYALQDMEDDALAGIRSSARRLGARVDGGVALFYLLAMLCLSLALWWIKPGAAWFALLPTLHLSWQLHKLRSLGASAALALFRANSWTGLLIFIAAFAAAL